MMRALARLGTIAIAAAVVVPMTGGTAGATTHPNVAADTIHGHSDLPADAPAALYRAEPSLPKAKGWPGSNTAFSRTSGTGRLDHGGYYWTDFLYDDHGTTTASAGDVSVTAGSPSFGTYTYPPGAAHQNGADIFRAAVYKDAHASYWRVDWNTLADPSIPVAEWTFDRDDNTSTGGSAWPGAAGVHSPGIGRALIVSSRGAQLVAVPGGQVLARPLADPAGRRAGRLDRRRLRTGGRCTAGPDPGLQRHLPQPRTGEAGRQLLGRPVADARAGDGRRLEVLHSLDLVETGRSQDDAAAQADRLE
jgi:hypothetical protein